ncbi:hypothetical protein KC336_g3102 [Hortaea werneckii]|nr:hypothetical protein KC336_g3102 [Hortaea werneckii]
MVQDGPSPKRRRADNVHAISAESMRQTNSTLRLFTGGKQNRWMQDWASNRGQGGADGRATGTPATPVGATNGRFDASLGREQQAIQLDQRTGVGRNELNSARHEMNGQVSGVANGTFYAGARPLSGDATVVDYESPDLSLPGSGGPPSQARKKRPDLQARTATGQGLPSPASSDDNACSPVIGGYDSASRLWHGRPPSRMASTASQSPRTLIDASSVHEVSTNPGQPRNIAPRPSTHNPGAPPNAALTRQAPSAHLPQSHLPPPPPPQAPPSNYSRVSSRSPSVHEKDQGQLPMPRRDDSSARHIPTTPVVPSNMPPTHHHQHEAAHLPTRPLAAFFSRDQLLMMIGEQLLIYEKQNGPEAHTGVGRLFLLREAVVKNDWFYIVLHQLYCLHTLIPESLPQSARLVEQDAFDRLDALLCANTMLQVPLVHWFSRFPAPMTTIATIAGGEGQRAYEYHGQSVVAFLKALRRSWDAIIAESHKRLAPPLVHDMIEQLTLLSPVLQTTMFRAVARMSWHAVPEYEAGIEFLLALHHRDQSAYNPRVTPPPSWKANAYHSFKLVLEEWTNYVQRRRPPRPPFLLPRFALTTFGIGVPGSGNQQSIQPAPSTNQSPVGGEPNHTAYSNQHGTHTPIQHRQWQLGHGHPPSIQTRGGHLPTGTPPNHLANMTTSANQPLLQPMPSNFPGPFPPAQAAYSQRAFQPTVLNQQQQQQQLQRSKRLLIPAAKECPRAQPTHPDFHRSALHQAHLRSPIPGPATLEPNAQKLFRQVTGCALSPNKIARTRPHQSWTFKPLDAHLDAVPPLAYGPEDKTKKYRILGDGAVTYRLRCCKFEPTIGFPDLSTWVTTDCSWPETAYFKLNGKALEARKKLHFGRYLPIDVTQYMTKRENTLELYLNRSSQDKSAFDFAVGIEVVHTISEERLLGKIQTISAQESLDTIRKSLCTAPKEPNEKPHDDNDDEDDDVIMTSSTLTIPLFDPISASQIFALPVRGAHCRHRDPFDLATFLATRKREKPGYPSSPDDWRCPICRGDARPDVLVKDAFLIRVREELASRDLLHTRAILVTAEGKWEVKKEVVSGVRSPSLEREDVVGASGSRRTSQRPASAAPVVIELD